VGSNRDRDKIDGCCIVHVVIARENACGWHPQNFSKGSDGVPKHWEEEDVGSLTTGYDTASQPASHHGGREGYLKTPPAALYVIGDDVSFFVAKGLSTVLDYLSATPP
jgi:hypothetical protein